MSALARKALAVLACALSTGCGVTPVVKSRMFMSSDADIVTMLSWKPAGKDWHFSLVPGSKKVTSLGFDAASQFVLQASPTAVGVVALKRHLLSFYAHKRRAIYWEDYPPAGFRYPPQTITRGIERFARANDIHLQLLPVLME